MSVVVIDPEELRALIGRELRAALDERAPVEASPEWLDSKGAAALLGVNVRTIAKLAQSGKVPSSRVGKLLRFRRADLLALLATQPTG